MVGSEPLREGAGAARVAAWAAQCGLPWDFRSKAPAPHAAMIAADWQGAADAFGAVGWCYDRALMLSVLDAREALVEAVDIARSHGAAPLEHRIIRRMHEVGLPVPRGPHASTRSNPAQLTDRQLEVLALIGQGRSNADMRSGSTSRPARWSTTWPASSPGWAWPRARRRSHAAPTWA
jgi:hypothetical protein